MWCGVHRRGQAGIRLGWAGALTPILLVEWRENKAWLKIISCLFPRIQSLNVSGASLSPVTDDLAMVPSQEKHRHYSKGLHVLCWAILSITLHSRNYQQRSVEEYFLSFGAACGLPEADPQHTVKLGFEPWPV